MNREKLYIHTIGCQMNVYDSDRMVGLLVPDLYDVTETPELADLIVVNTCAIRAKAEQKVFSYLGRLAKWKEKRPELLIAVGGCVAQQEGEKILKRVPAVDLVFGTHAIGRLADNVRRVKSEGRAVVDLVMSSTLEDAPGPGAAATGNPISQFVTIMRGCDNYCTYCVVPYVRGRECSRAPERIVDQIGRLVDTGVKEVTLLGQNVNSYGLKEGRCSFPELLGRVNGIDGLLRVRFTTSHPKDLSDDLIAAFGSLDKLCRHIHLPVQSGSDKILRRMNRKYTRAHYLEKTDKLRRQCPDISITSDFIVGFPGETEADFQATLDLVKTVAFDSLFAFMYSDRPNAPAGRFSDKVSEAVKRDRLGQLLELQETRNALRHGALIGSVQRILVDGLSKNQVSNAGVAGASGLQWSGRTSGNKIVHFEDHHHRRDARPPLRAGTILDIRIEKAFSHSLWGRPIDIGDAECPSAGEGRTAGGRQPVPDGSREAYP